MDIFVENLNVKARIIWKHIIKFYNKNKSSYFIGAHKTDLVPCLPIGTNALIIWHSFITTLYSKISVIKSLKLESLNNSLNILKNDFFQLNTKRDPRPPSLHLHCNQNNSEKNLSKKNLFILSVFHIFKCTFLSQFTFLLFSHLNTPILSNEISMDISIKQ